jgi:succinate-semialdehyde dehydrogenase/glutarate-semialdehyde dehydrogenase
VHTDLWIDGDWREAKDGSRFDVIDPATERPIASVADATVEDALDAVTAASEAQREWAAAAPRERAEVLRDAWVRLTAANDELAALITAENGKPLVESRGEVAYAAEFFRWFSEEAVRLRGEVTTAPAGANKIVVLHQPVGVALMITPWNFPAAMATRKIAPALAAGCGCVLKPASLTPLTALAIAAILDDAGVPPGLVNVVPTRRTGDVVDGVLRDDRVRKLSFTGSTEVGRGLIAKASARVVNVSMELGGNAPFIVFADADLDAAIEGAMIAKMRHNGETCTAANRFYVEDAIAEAFTARLAEAMAALPVGPGTEQGVRVGPLVDEDTLAKVAGLVDAAVASGARVRTGGTRPEGTGYYYPPTVLDRVAPGSAILQEEIFGPVAPIVTFTAEADAIRMANDTPFGLVSYLYTGDLARGLRVAEALESGMVGLNKGIVSDPAAPFGGVKQSGIGREGGHEGMLDYCETKYIATDW